MSSAKQLADAAKNRGFDALTPEERRKRVRELLDQPTLTQEREDELDVLLLMAIGMTEAMARVDLVLRKRQRKILQRKATFV